MLDRIRINIQNNNLLVGFLLVLLGIAAPLIINVDNFGILLSLKAAY